MTVLIIGCGDIGLRIARRLAGHQKCYGLIRQQQRIDTLKAAGVIPLIHNLDETKPLALPSSLNIATLTVFYLAPPDRNNLLDNRIGKVLRCFDKPPAKWVYISTSGVYGQHHDNWVTEQTPPQPISDRAKRRVSAETQLLNWQQQKKAAISILRVPGIYGPGRLPLKRLVANEPVIALDESPYTNLIHADDLASVCLAASKVDDENPVFNISDGHPIRISEYYLKIAKLAGLPIPAMISLEQAQQTFEPRRLSFINESRRMNVNKMFEKISPSLKYPDTDLGIRASLADVT